MSAKELTQVEALARVKVGTLSLKSAAVLLHVGYRQRSDWCTDIERKAPRDCGTAVLNVGRITRAPRPSATESLR